MLRVSVALSAIAAVSLSAQQGQSKLHFSQSDSLTLNIWTVSVDTQWVQRLWAYDTTCSRQTPLPNHSWQNVTWLGADLMEAFAKRDSLNRFPARVLGYWQNDTIYLDTTLIVHFPPQILRKIMAHELMHQLLYYRVPVDPTSNPRTREYPDSVHPTFPFVWPCQLMNITPLPFDKEEK